MDFRTFVRILGAHWKLALAALLTCTMGAAAVTALQTKYYQSSVTVLISFSGATDLWDLYNGTLTSQERLSTYAQIAGGRTVAERAIGKVQVQMSPETLLSRTQVKYTAKSMLVTITVKDTDPARAAALVGAMADQFDSMVPTLGGLTPRTSDNAPPPDVAGQPNAKPLPAASSKIVEAPRIPDRPVAPAPMRNMLIGFIAGLLLAVAVALAREASDRTVRTREKLEELSGLPVLAELPGKRGSAARFGSDVTFDDAIRGLVARLRRTMGPQGNRLLLTAPFGGEGTTTTVLNLSRAFAELGEQVLLVEGDTRRPVIAGLLRVESGEGLTNVLANPSSVAEVVRPTSIARLSILASRAARREALPVSAYQPTVIDRVLADLSTRYDRIVVDGPPVLATADTAVLSGAVEAVVLVVRAGRTTFDELNDALTALRAVNAQLVGAVLTAARPSLHSRAMARTYQSKARGSA